MAEFAASILSLEGAKCEIASVQHLRAAYVQTVKHFRTPRHYDNGGKMPCNLEAETKSKVGTAHRPGSPWRRMTIPMALTDYELWPSNLKLRPSHCQITIRQLQITTLALEITTLALSKVTSRQSACLWHITTLILEIMTRALSNYDRLIPLSVTDYDPRTWNYDLCTLKLRPANPLVCDRLRLLHLKLRPVHSQITTR